MFDRIKKKHWKGIIENTFWMVFDKIFMLILNLFITVKIANYYGSTDYGLYQYAASIVAIIEIVVAFVDGRIVKKQYLLYRPADIVRTATISRMLFSLFSFVFGVALSVVMNLDALLRLIFLLLLINAIVSNLRFGMVNRLEYLLESKKVVLSSNFAFLIGGICQLFAVYRNAPICIIALINVVSSVINLLIVFVLYKKRFYREKGCLNKKILKNMLKESLPLAIAASCSTIYTRCDSIMLGIMLNTTMVGVYSISLKLINIVQIAYIPIRESVYPKLIELYHINYKMYEKRYIQISSIMTWMYIIGVMFAFIVLPHAFQVLKSEYLDAYDVFKYHVLGTFFIYNSALRAGHYALVSRGDILMKVQIVCVFINITSNFIGIKLFGMYGAVLATVFTEFISLWISNIFFKEGRQVFIWQIKALNPIYIISKSFK